jgi:predicted CopG family antitoxin
MGTKTIGLREDVYERLRARKREGESFTDLVDRLLDEREADWREGFGALSAEEASDLRSVTEAVRDRTAADLAARQARANERLSEVLDDDETA